jgi:hypothetical protein
LRARLWPGRTHMDFEHGLNKAVNRLRQALGDSASNPRFVATVARRGYRFLAPVGGGWDLIRSGLRFADPPGGASICECQPGRRTGILQ